jgi:hypothetical protein
MYSLYSGRYLSENGSCDDCDITCLECDGDDNDSCTPAYQTLAASMTVCANVMKD